MGDVSVMRYRAITGACNLGCQGFMDRNKIKYHLDDNGRVVEEKPVKAKDLLVLLKKENAYGYEKFEKLMA